MLLSSRLGIQIQIEAFGKNVCDDKQTNSRRKDEEKSVPGNQRVHPSAAAAADAKVEIGEKDEDFSEQKKHFSLVNNSRNFHSSLSGEKIEHRRSASAKEIIH